MLFILHQNDGGQPLFVTMQGRVTTRFVHLVSPSFPGFSSNAWDGCSSNAPLATPVSRINGGCTVHRGQRPYPHAWGPSGGWVINLPIYGAIQYTVYGASAESGTNVTQHSTRMNLATHQNTDGAVHRHGAVYPLLRLRQENIFEQNV